MPLCRGRGFPRLFCSREVCAGVGRTGAFFFSLSLHPFFRNFLLEEGGEPAFSLQTSSSCLPAPASPAHSFNKGSCSQRPGALRAGSPSGPHAWGPGTEVGVESGLSPQFLPGFGWRGGHFGQTQSIKALDPCWAMG